MLANAMVVNLRRKSASDAYGQPTRTAAAGQWPCIIQAKSRKVVIGSRELVSRCQALIEWTTAAAAPIQMGDLVDVRPLASAEAVTYEVYEVEPIYHPVLGHLVLRLGDPT